MLALAARAASRRALRARAALSPDNRDRSCRARPLLVGDRRARAATNASTSASRRRPPEADPHHFARRRLASQPIADSTWLGFMLPDEQALPADTAIPAMIEPDQLRRRRHPRHAIGADHRTARPRLAHHCAARVDVNAPARARREGSPSAPDPRARSAPQHSRAAPGRFSVPARYPRSCPPVGSSVARSRTSSAPTPGGPPRLCAESATKSACARAPPRPRRAGICAASTSRTPPAACTMLGDRRDRLAHSGLAVRPLHRRATARSSPAMRPSAPLDRRCRPHPPAVPRAFRVRAAPHHARPR